MSAAGFLSVDSRQFGPDRALSFVYSTNTSVATMCWALGYSGEKACSPALLRSQQSNMSIEEIKR